MTLILASNRRKAVEHLRTTTLPQGYGNLYDRKTGCYCALGHIGLAVGIDAAGSKFPPYDQIAEAMDMDNKLSGRVEFLNDSLAKNLTEIGDYLAAEWGIA